MVRSTSWSALFVGFACAPAVDSGDEHFGRSALAGVWVNVVDDPRYDLYEDFGLGPAIGRGLVRDAAAGSIALEGERAVLLLELDDPTKLDAAHLGVAVQECEYPWGPGQRASVDWQRDLYFSTYPMGRGTSPDDPLLLVNTWQHLPASSDVFDFYGELLGCYLMRDDLLVCQWVGVDQEFSATVASRQMAFRNSSEAELERPCDALLSDYLVAGGRP
jgi:hypothetical protein